MSMTGSNQQQTTSIFCHCCENDMRWVLRHLIKPKPTLWDAARLGKLSLEAVLSEYPELTSAHRGAVRLYFRNAPPILLKGEEL